MGAALGNGLCWEMSRGISMVQLFVFLWNGVCWSLKVPVRLKAVISKSMV
jgi:hypothetical protein